MKKLLFLNFALLCVLGILTTTSSSFIVPGAVLSQPEGVLMLTASWYGLESCVNPDCLMANGEVFNENEISCASRTHYGKVLEISYKGRTILCPVKDKISKTYDATIVDLSKQTFMELTGDLSLGVVQIVIK